MNRKPISVSLVLGSGGARGLAHIGIIEWLNDNGYEIRSIAGTSIGALIGGIYAASKLETYKHWVQALDKTDVIRFLDFSFSSSGLIKGDRIIDALREIVGVHLIEELPITYTAIATDIVNQREIWFSDGPLFDAIRASISVPTIFTPHDYQGMHLVDGGLLNPVPIAPTFKDRTDLTIAVNLNGPRQEAKNNLSTEPTTEKTENQDNSYRQRIEGFFQNLQGNILPQAKNNMGLFELINGSFETMQNAISSFKLGAYSPDVLIEIPRDTCAIHEFHRAEEMFSLGYKLTGEAMKQQETKRLS